MTALRIDRPVLVRALVLALSAWVAFAIATLVHVQNAYWAAMPVWVVAQASRGVLLERALFRVVGTLLGAAVGFAILHVPVDPYVQFALLGLWVAVNGGLTHVLRGVHGYGALLAGITAAIVVVPSVLAPGASLELATARVECTLIGVVVATVITGLATPESPRQAFFLRIRLLSADAVAYAAGVLRSGASAMGGEKRRILAEISEAEASARLILAGSFEGYRRLHDVDSLMVGMPIAALLASSQFMVVATTGAIGVTLGSVLHDVPSDQIMSALVMLTILVGLFQLFLGFIKAGGLVRYVSNAVLIGFMTGIVSSLTAALFPSLASTRITPVSAIRSTPYSEEGFLSGKRLRIAAVSLVSFSAVLLILFKTLESSTLFHNRATMFLATIFFLLGISLATPWVLEGFLAFYRTTISPRAGAAGRLAGLNLQKNITRNAVAAAAIFYGIAVFVSSSGIIYSTKQSVLDWIDSYVRGDIIVTSGHPIATTGSQNIPMPIEMGKAIEQVPGVLSADPFRKLFIDYHGRRILLLTLDVKRRMAYSPFKIARGKREDMARLLPNQNYIAVNEAIASQEHLKPGDGMVLPTPEGPVEFKVAVVNVDYSSDSGSILMDMNTYHRYWKEFLADSFSVRVTNKNEVEAVRNEIARRFGNDRRLFVLPSAEFKGEIRKIIDQGFAVNHAINIITMIIACFGIIVTLLASVLERTREIGILRSIGMLRSQVSRVVIIESMLLGIIGGALGAGAGIIVGWMSLEGFLKGDYGASMQYHVHTASLFWAIALSTLLAALAGVYPAQRAAKTNIVEALSYE